jgi:hypothetical protein
MASAVAHSRRANWTLNGASRGYVGVRGSEGVAGDDEIGRPASQRCTATQALPLVSPRPAEKRSRRRSIHAIAPSQRLSLSEA